LLGGKGVPEMPGEEVREPAFGMRAYSVPDMFADDLKRDGYAFADNMSVLLTHLSEVIRNNLPQLLSYKDMKALLERQDPEYKKLADEICTSHICPIPACRRCSSSCSPSASPSAICI
jgi:flagellar biosynthesis protein FlhA